MNESTTAQLNAQELRNSSQRTADWFRLDAALEKVKAIWAGMAGSHDNVVMADKPAGEPSLPYDHYDRSSDDSVRGSDSAHVQAMRVHITDKSVVFLLVGLCVMGTAWAIFEANRAQERADLLQIEVESFKNVLHELHLPTSAHLPGEKP